MKSLFFFSALCGIFLFPSCNQSAIVLPSCEEFRLGTICFDNNTNNEIRIIVDNNKADILPFSNVCFEMNEGWYDYTGKRFLKRWRGEVLVERCQTIGVGLFD
ncbi:MAG: hypothetical protein ACI85O_000431 [Saprospiraceae bacterium]|jgi:hypothetical protein